MLSRQVWNTGANGPALCDMHLHKGTNEREQCSMDLLTGDFIRGLNKMFIHTGGNMCLFHM